MTSFLLARAGVPTPPTWTMESAEAARALVEREAPRGPLVLKPLFGAQGKGLRLIRRPEDLPGPEDVAGVYYLQRFQSNGTEDFTDYRLFVLRGRVIAAMMRRASTWITNVKQGGQPLAVAPDPKMERLAIAAAEAVGAAIAGVDVLVDADGAPTVLEVNSMPAWSGLQKVSKRNIAEAIASALMDSWRVRPVATARSHERRRRSSGGAPISRRASRSSTRPNRATCIGSRPATAWRSRTSFAAPRRAPLPSRRGARGSESASAPPSTRPSRRSVRTPISASSSCARRSRRPRRSPTLALRPALAEVLDRLDRADAADVFSAIAAANPGGLGRAPRHDVQRSCHRDAARGDGGGGGAGSHRAAVRHDL